MIPRAFDPLRSSRRRRQHESEGNRDYEPFALELFEIEHSETGMIRVLTPETGNFPDVKLHWTAKGPKTCTAEMAEFDGRCTYCHTFEKGKEDKKFGRLRPVLITVVEIIDFRYHHKVRGDDGKLMLVTCASNDPVPTRNNRCRYCSSTDPAIRERIFGGHKVWELRSRNFNQIDDVNTKLGQVCLFDKGDGTVCGKEVFIVGYACSKCGGEILAEHDLQTGTDETLGAVIDNPDFVCPHCKNQDYPVEMLACESGEHDPSPATMCDKCLEVSCTGVVKQGQNGQYTETNYNFDRSAQFSHPFDDLAPHLNNNEEAMAEMLKSWDLVHRYRPEKVDRDKFDSDAAYVDAVLGKQAATLGVESPFKTAAPARSRAFRPNGGGDPAQNAASPPARRSFRR